MTASPNRSGLYRSSMPTNASSSAIIRGQWSLAEEYSALAAANSGRWIAADFSPPDMTECLARVSRTSGSPGWMSSSSNACQDR